MEWNLIQCERDLTQLFWIMNWESSHLWISLCIFFTVQLEIYKINIKFIHSAKKIMFLNLYNIWCEILLCERELLSIGRKIIIDGHFYRMNNLVIFIIWTCCLFSDKWNSTASDILRIHSFAECPLRSWKWIEKCKE